MQRTLMVLSRLIFGGTLLMLLVVALMGVILNVYEQQPDERIVNEENRQNRIISAALAEAASEQPDGEVSNELVVADARPLLIKKYLEKYNSPLAPYYKMIFDLSETYGFAYYWILAIGQQESNLCKKIPENSYNCWGYGINSAGTLRFASYELALKSFAEYLKREYFDKGLNTPELIMKKYCPHSNGSWAYGVGHFIEEIETGNF